MATSTHDFSKQKSVITLKFKIRWFQNKELFGPKVVIKYELLVPIIPLRIKTLVLFSFGIAVIGVLSGLTYKRD